MDKEFWLKKWENKKIGFHQPKYNPFLLNFWPKFADDTEVVFVPLCGKSLDLLYFIERGHKVVGVEFSEAAVKEFFSENKLNFSVSTSDKFTIYTSENIKIYCGNFFDLTLKDLAEVKYVYDRASIIALDSNLRSLYSEHLAKNIKNLKSFVITLEFDNSNIGPPFSIDNKMLSSLFQSFNCSLIDQVEIPIETTPHASRISICYNNVIFISS